MTELGPTWCGCPGSVVNTDNYTCCSVCLGKYDLNRVPVGLECGHTICRKCWKRVQPEAQGIPNVALMNYLDLPAVQLPVLEPDCISSICRLSELGQLLKSSSLSRAITRKVVHLITSLTWNGQSRLVRGCRAVGERVLTELSTSCSHLSHYHAQQQLWAAIRSRACQFMGPAMQEEALKLVLLALEDGSPLSRKVLVMFVVQRLAPQFPQASKTSIGHVIQLLYRASSFDVVKRPSASSLMTLRPEYRNYTALRREHDSQIVKIALESGIRFSPEQWSSILYGDVNQKSHMQSIIDKLQAPQTFTQMTNEFLISIQRLNTDDNNYLLQAHPKFQLLASIEYQQEYLPWKLVCMALESVYSVLNTLITFNAKSSTGTGSSNNQSRKKVFVEEDSHSLGLDSRQLVEDKVVQQLLNESRQLRVRMREVQETIPWAAHQLEQESNQLDIESNRLEKLLHFK